MRRNEIIAITVALILLVAVISPLALKDIIDTAQTIEIVITFTLVLITAIYVKRTSDIAEATKEQAKATKEQADASVKMAEEMREQRYDAVRPVIDIINIEQTPLELARQAYEKKPPNELRCKLCNVGVGPAIDVYSFVQPPSHERQRHHFHTIAIGKETIPMNLSLEQKDDRWFLVAYYKDVYGQCFESSREVRVGVVNPDPLKFRNISEEE